MWCVTYYTTNRTANLGCESTTFWVSRRYQWQTGILSHYQWHGINMGRDRIPKQVVHLLIILGFWIILGNSLSVCQASMQSPLCMHACTTCKIQEFFTHRLFSIYWSTFFTKKITNLSDILIAHQVTRVCNRSNLASTIMRLHFEDRMTPPPLPN